MLEKRKKIRLPNKQKEINDEVYKRDDGHCIFCGDYIPEGTKFHHVRHGANKEDKIENAVMLCFKHHNFLHHGNDKELIRKIDERCKNYLFELYGEKSL